MPVKIFRQCNLAENIIDSGKISRNNLNWRDTVTEENNIFFKNLSSYAQIP